MTGLQRLLDQLRLASAGGGTGGMLAPSGSLDVLKTGGAGGLPATDSAQKTSGEGSVPSLQPSQPAQTSQAGDPLANLVNGFQAWSRAHGGRGERYAQLAHGHRTAGGMLEGLGGRAVQQVADPNAQGLAQVGRLNQSGNARNGLGFQTYELGGGLMAHVYYDAKTGRRQVVKFRQPPAAG